MTRTSLVFLLHACAWSSPNTMSALGKLPCDYSPPFGRGGLGRLGVEVEPSPVMGLVVHGTFDEELEVSWSCAEPCEVRWTLTLGAPSWDTASPATSPGATYTDSLIFERDGDIGYGDGVYILVKPQSGNASHAVQVLLAGFADAVGQRSMDLVSSDSPAGLSLNVSANLALGMTCSMYVSYLPGHNWPHLNDYGSAVTFPASVLLSCNTTGSDCLATVSLTTREPNKWDAIDTAQSGAVRSSGTMEDFCDGVDLKRRTYDGFNNAPVSLLEANSASCGFTPPDPDNDGDGVPASSDPDDNDPNNPNPQP
jgi:hypothetical protein